MRYRYLLSIILMTVAMQAQAGRKLKVLFIGNSYTYVNSLPMMIADMAATMGDTLIHDSHTIGGATFGDHATMAACIQKIQAQNWDLIVLQEQSLTPAMQTGTFFNTSYHNAGILDTIIEHADPCIQKMFYMTWGRKNGDSNMAAIQGIPALATYEGMDSLIRARYFAYADTSIPPTMGIPLMPGAWFHPVRLSQLSPVGYVWNYIRKTYPNINLYDADESHPSQAGSYAAACTFYAAMFRKDPSKSPYNYTLNATDAANIKAVAKLKVFDSMHLWYLGTHPGDVRSQFRYQYVGGNQAIMINQSSGTLTGYQWDLGDGTTSTSGTFFHDFPAAGTYTVRLITTENGCSDTSYEKVTVGPLAVGNVGQEDEIIISPNPTKDRFAINLPAAEAKVTILNIHGQVVYTATARGKLTVDLTDHAAGVYLVRIASGDSVWERKLVKE